MDTPILLLTYNRLELTQRVFQTLSDLRPTKLYLSSDGPADDIVSKEVMKVREFLVNNVNWDCQVETYFRKENLGCGPGVKDSIDWFFSKEERGIILEDDTVPIPSFYKFCSELLNFYKDDHRIGMISGNNHFNRSPSNSSYFFSRNKGCWGWATWRRAWVNMDFEMSWLNGPYESAILANMGFSKYSSEYWKLNIDAILNNRVDTWDWQWYFSLARQNQLCIIPQYNLVANEGFGNSATHTKGTPDQSFLRTKEILFPLSHPENIVPFDKFDEVFERERTSLSKLTQIKRLIPSSILSLLAR